MRTIDVESHFTELDRSLLENNEAYLRYFNRVKHILNCLLDSFNTREEDDPHELEVIQSFAQKFLNTIEALSLKYCFDEESRMPIDLTVSGFPNHLEFRKINADLLSKKEVSQKFESKDTLKQQVLDHLFDKQTEPNHWLKQLAQVEYFEQLKGSHLFQNFTEGKLELIKKFNDEENTRRFVFSWGSYDSVTNRPYIYVMMFDNPGSDRRRGTDIRKDKDFIEAIKKSTHDTAPLKVVAADIDAAYEDIQPKVLKRIDLGPIFSSFSLDDHKFSKVLTEHFSEKDFLFSYTTEVIFSTGEKRTNSFLSKGELRQVFLVDESNKECIERMVSEVHHYILSTHSVLQHLNQHFAEDLKNLSAPPHVCPDFTE